MDVVAHCRRSLYRQSVSAKRPFQIQRTYYRQLARKPETGPVVPSTILAVGTAEQQHNGRQNPCLPLDTTIILPTVLPTTRFGCNCMRCLTPKPHSSCAASSLPEKYGQFVRRSGCSPSRSRSGPASCVHTRAISSSNWQWCPSPALWCAPSFADPWSSSFTLVHVTMIPASAERKRQDMLCPIRWQTLPQGCDAGCLAASFVQIQSSAATADAARDGKILYSGANSGDLYVRWHATWGMSV